MEKLKFRITKDCSIIGGPSPLASSWLLAFAGEDEEAERKARKALGALKIDDKHWDELSVALPSGETARIYISPDKSEKQIFTEMATKRLVDAVKKIHPTGLPEVHGLKRDGMVTIGWQRAIKVEPKADKTCSLLLIPDLVDKYHLNKDAIEESFNVSLAATGVNLQWCP